MRVWWIVVAGLLTVCVACGTGSESGSSAVVATDDAAATTDDADARDQTSADDAGVNDDRGSDDTGDDDADTADDSSPFGEYRSPLAEFLGNDFTDMENNEAEIMRLEAEAEQATAECMQALGFEYTPRDSSEFIFFSGPGGDLEYGSDAWIDKYGFGITTQRFPQSMVGPDLVGMDDEMMGGPMGGDMSEDPNQAYIETLSDGAQQAYFEALHGQPPAFDPSTMSDEEMNEAMNSFVPGGCFNEAREELFGGGPMGPDQDFYEAFGDQLENLYERVESDPRIVGAQAEVSECVSAGGLFWSGRMQDVYEQFESELSRIDMNLFGDPFAGTDLDPSQMSQEELDDFFENLPPPQLTPENKALLGQLQTEEIELAVAVRDCGGGPRDLDGLYNEVRIELEERFLADNADALEPFRNDG